MASTVQGSVTSGTRLIHTNSTGSARYSGAASIAFEKSFTTTDITKIFSGTRSLTTNETLDLSTGLTNAFGEALVFATVRDICIVNNHATNTLTVGGGTNGLCNQLPVINGGGCIHLTVKQTVDGTHKNLLLTASAALTYDIIVVGV